MVSTIVTLAQQTTPLRTIQLLRKDHHMASQIVILYLHQRPLLSATTPSVNNMLMMQQMDQLIPSTADSLGKFTPAISIPITSVITLESSLENKE